MTNSTTAKNVYLTLYFASKALHKNLKMNAIDHLKHEMVLSESVRVLTPIFRNICFSIDGMYKDETLSSDNLKEVYADCQKQLVNMLNQSENKIKSTVSVFCMCVYAYILEEYKMDTLELLNSYL